MPGGAATLALAHGQERYLRLGYWTLLAVALPGYVLMRIVAEWIYSKEFGDSEEDPAWVGIGYITADLGLLLLLIALIIGGIGVYRLRRGGGPGLLKGSMAISVVLLAAYVVAVVRFGGVDWTAFTLSFAGSFIALYAVEAVLLRRLTARLT